MQVGSRQSSVASRWLSVIGCRLSVRCFGTSVPKLVFLCALLIALAIPAFPAEVTKTLAEGVTFTQTIQSDRPDAMIINVLRVDTKNPNVKIESALAGDSVLADDATKGRETISRLVERRGALAGINADFFPFTGDPLGVAIVNGDLVSEPFAGRAAVGISRGGWVLFDKLRFNGQLIAPGGVVFKIHGVNRPRGANELICYTPAFGCESPAKNDCVDVTLTGLPYPLPPNKAVQAVVQTIAPGSGTAIAKDGCVLSGSGTAGVFLNNNLHPGDTVTLKFDLLSQMGKNWAPIVQAVGGGPWLVLYGQVRVDGDAEKFDGSLVRGRHPRTAIGITADKELLLVTVDGRQWVSRGMTLLELAELMKSLGAVMAINLDGGGSTSMSLKGMVVNSPCEGIERAVANALLINTVETGAWTPEIRFAIPRLDAQVGVNCKLALMSAASGLELPEPYLSRVVWGAKGGRGFVNQSGLFTPLRAGSGVVVAVLGDKRAELPVTVTAGPPAALTALIKADPSGDVNRSVVEAKLTDVGGAAVAGKPVRITIVGGVADASEVLTDSKGVASFGVTWDQSVVPSARSATVSANGLAPVTVTYPQAKGDRASTLHLGCGLPPSQSPLPRAGEGTG